MPNDKTQATKLDDAELPLGASGRRDKIQHGNAPLPSNTSKRMALLRRMNFAIVEICTNNPKRAELMRRKILWTAEQIRRLDR